MWEPQPLTTLRASKACRGENFTFTASERIDLFRETPIMHLNGLDINKCTYLFIGRLTKTNIQKNILKNIQILIRGGHNSRRANDREYFNFRLHRTLLPV
jgi:hypothetical protein